MANMTGGCLCGRVRYTVTGVPAFSGICHCRNCQRYTGSAFETLMAFPAEAAVGVETEGQGCIRARRHNSVGLDLELHDQCRLQQSVENLRPPPEFDELASRDRVRAIPEDRQGSIERAAFSIGDRRARREWIASIILGGLVVRFCGNVD